MNTQTENWPRITIVTSTFNAVNDLQWTINSIRSQTYPNIQWIIIDGGSEDGTLRLIQENLDIIDYWHSSRDNGIYNAWNKAIPHVNGDWVQFLGAGDELANPDTTKNVAEYLIQAYPKYEIVYGRLLFLSQKGRKPVEEIGSPWEALAGRWFGLRPCLPVHPEVYHHISLFNGANSFDERFKIAGDNHFLLKSIQRKDPLYVPILVDKMPLGGASGRINSAWKVARETALINKDLGIHPPLFVVISEWAKVLLKMAISYVIPKVLLFKAADIWRMSMGKEKRWTIS